MQALLKLTNFVSKTFALWAIVFALLAFLFPEQFKIFAPYIPYLLGLVMFGMGITLTFADFSEVLNILNRYSLVLQVNLSLCRLSHLD